MTGLRVISVIEIVKRSSKLLKEPKEDLYFLLSNNFTLSTSMPVHICGFCFRMELLLKNVQKVSTDLLHLKQEIRKNHADEMDDAKRIRRRVGKMEETLKSLEERIGPSPSPAPHHLSPDVTSTPAPHHLSPDVNSTPISAVASAPLYSGLSQKDLVNAARQLSCRPINMTKFIAQKLFSDEQLASCSVSGKRTFKSGDSPRPALDRESMTVLEKVVQEVCPAFTHTQMVAAIGNLQKCLRKKM